MSDKKAMFLLALGLLAIAGDTCRGAGEALEWPRVVAAGQAVTRFATATCASPAPKVFSAVKGLETYSTRFLIEWREAQGARRVVELTPELTARIRGPYTRRNVYGTALTYGPMLMREVRTRPMYEQVMRHALCDDAPMLRELGVDPATVHGPVTVRLEPGDAEQLDGRAGLAFEAACDD